MEIGQVEQGAYIYLRNKVTNNLLVLRLNEDDKKLVFNSEVDGQWGTETELVTKSDLQHYPRFYRTNGLKDIALQLYKYSDSTYILQIILITSTFTKTINLAEFTM